MTDPDVRAKFEKAWGSERTFRTVGLDPAMMDGLTTGKVKVFYIFGENLANTEPHIAHVEHALESADFIVCHDIFPTETTRFADVILRQPLGVKMKARLPTVSAGSIGYGRSKPTGGR